MSLLIAIAIGVLGSVQLGDLSGCATPGWIGNCTVSVQDGSTVEVDAKQLSPVRSLDETGRLESFESEPEAVDCGALNRCDFFTVSTIPEATLSDVASFAPTASVLAGEPAGHGIVGLPTNFTVSAEEHVATGTLFDLPVTVRFRPVGATILAGDGARIDTDTTGESWSSLGLAPFSPTATSHVYTERGVYTATAEIRYRADVDFGRGWRPVAGVLEIASSGYRVDVLEVRSALVERSCLEDPRGPGC